MGRQSKKSRIYWRERGGTKRAYADVRDYADVGGGREALVAEGEKLATADETTAQVLLARRLKQRNASTGRSTFSVPSGTSPPSRSWMCVVGPTASSRHPTVGRGRCPRAASGII